MRALMLAGQKFGRLTVIERDITRPRGKVWWRCVCDCGNEVVRYGPELRAHLTPSCGCARRDNASRLNRTHGLSRTPTYVTWRGMVERVTNPNHIGARTYGNISIDPRWLKFAGFYEDMGHRPPGSSIDRIDPAGPYCKENCRWTDAITQANNKTTTKRITYKGITDTVRGWSNRTGIPHNRLRARILRGMDISTALSYKWIGSNNRHLPHEQALSSAR